MTERIIHNELETQPVRARASKRPMLRVTTQPDDAPDTRSPELINFRRTLPINFRGNS